MSTAPEQPVWPTDAQLVERAAGGDQDAFRRLVERHATAARRLAERRLPDRLRRRISVADVVQEAQIAALQNLAAFEDRGDRAFRNWLLGIVEHKVRDVVRRHEASSRRSLRREVPRGRRAGTAFFAGKQATPSQVAIGAETANRVRAAMARLPDDYREVLMLTRSEGLDLRAAAERMGRTYAATRKLVSRAIERLHEEIGAGEGGDGDAS